MKNSYLVAIPPRKAGISTHFLKGLSGKPREEFLVAIPPRKAGISTQNCKISTKIHV